MSLKKMLKFFDPETFVPVPNISKFINNDLLTNIGREVMLDFEDDEASMTDWTTVVEEGRKLCKMSFKPRNDPFTNASNYKSSAMAQASLDFSDRISYEILKPEKLVKIQTSDNVTQESEAATERLSNFSNWQVNTQMGEWRDEHEKLLYDLPHTGTVFKKSFYDTAKQRIRSELITFPNFAVDNNTKSMESLRRFSEKFTLTYNVIEENMRSKYWNKTEFLHGSVNEEGAKGMYDFIEQSTWLDLDDDGYEEPYIVVIKKNTHEVMRITPRYLLRDVKLVDDITLMEYVSSSQLDESVTIKEKEILRIEPLPQLTKYGFIKDIQGGFLDIGYAHLLGGLTQVVNATANMLLDAGKLSNLSGGWLAKGFRIKMGDARVEPGEWLETGIDASQLHNGVLPFAFKEPSPTLYQLNMTMRQEIERLANSADLSEAIGANAPATTTLALINEQQQASSSIMLRIFRAMTTEFNVISTLNSIYLDEKEYSDITGVEGSYYNLDLHTPGIEIRPAANPNTSSKIQRIMQTSAELSQIPNIQQAGGNIRPIMEHYLETIDSSIVDTVFPEQTPDQQLQELLARYPELEQQISKAQENASALTKAQTDYLNEKTQREDLKVAIDMDKADSENKERAAKTIKTEADAISTLASIPDELQKAERERILKQQDEKKLNQ